MYETGKASNKRSDYRWLFTVMYFVLFFIMGMLMPFWIMRDVYEKMMLDSIGIDYTCVVLDLFEKIVWAGHGVFLA
ncbi:hypothetical protein [uncultured Sphaerochaeta sp.]|uniref:hypothetical protein n=1 Tax=uncultured Sphaerochaeta sp. TaxID=886478 RepID=UPI002A0A362D|nr:hypothetical protein [uncultured Sphaerochaeta sp.]